ncbi:hypothetical protein [Bacteroides sp.]|uniref:hypothetical protein n=1 Tax=Bacteroides sp. TaxID=29523 RepID=UPI003AB45872
MNDSKRETYEPPSVEVLTVAVEYGFAGTGGSSGSSTTDGSADTTLPGWGSEDGSWE